MKPAAAVLLLLALAGTPAMTLVCVGWCAPDGMPVDVSCHRHGSGAAVVVTSNDDTCAQLLTTSPYLTEEIRLIATVMSASVPYAISLATGEALLAPVHDVASVFPQRAPSSLVLRL